METTGIILGLYRDSHDYRKIALLPGPVARRVKRGKKPSKKEKNLNCTCATV